MKSMEDQAQYKLVQNKTAADISCAASPFADDYYWELPGENAIVTSECDSADCASSSIAWNNKDQNKELHVVSVNAAPAFRWGDMEQGGSIKVNIKASDKTQIITLVSRKRLEWNFAVQKGAKIEKVIVATPELVWLTGLDPAIPIEYLPKDKMCAYPYTWQEAFNPDNEFRVLMKSLQKVAGVPVTSFQGAQVGRTFRIPMAAAAAVPREIASVNAAPKVQKVEESSVWTRKNGHVIAESLKGTESENIPLPEKTAQVLKGPEKSVYIVADGRLKRWNNVNRQFDVLHTPMFLPDAGEVKAMALDDRDEALFVYNDQRGGEMYKYFMSMNKWVLLARGFNYNFQSFYFDKSKNVLMGLASQGNYLTQIVYLDDKGRVLKTDELKNRVAFDKKRWRLEVAKNQETAFLKIFTPAVPVGYAQNLE